MKYEVHIVLVQRLARCYEVTARSEKIAEEKALEQAQEEWAEFDPSVDVLHVKRVRVMMKG